MGKQWLEGLMISDGQQGWKFVNGEPPTTQDDINATRGNTLGSHYVFCIPSSCAIQACSSKTPER